MNKATLTLILLFFVLPVQNLFCQNEGTPVEIHETIEPGQVAPPKAPALPSIICIYYESVSTFTFSFLSDLGIAHIIVENQTTHELVFEIVNTNTGSASLFVPFSLGIYTVNITLSNGSEYYGEIEI